MVHLVALLQPAQDRDGVLDARLLHEHRLEAALERGVLLDVLAVLVERGGADRAQLPAREHRLEQVGGVDRALGGTRAHDRVELVEEQDDAPLGLGDLLQDSLEAVLELAAVLGAGDQRADVECDDATVAQRLRHVARDDPLGEALDDRGLADAGLADQHGVVLRAAGEHLDHAPDLVVAADHRVELVVLGRLGEVAAEALERLVAVLGVLVGHAVRAAHLLDGLRELVAGRARVDRRLGGEGEQQVLGRDVLVAHPARLLVGVLEEADQVLAERRRARLAADRGLGVERLVRAPAHALRVGPGAAQHGHDDAAVLLEQRQQQMLRRDLRIAARASEALRGRERLLRLDCESVCLHRKSKCE